MRSDIAQGDGVYKSTDGGRTWTPHRPRGLAADRAHPGRSARIRIACSVAALGHPYGPNAERGVFRSHDGGKSWQKVLFKDDDTGAIDLAFRPGDPSVIYAALWQTRRPPWNVYPPSNGPGSGLYKSTDGGSTWTPITGHGFPAQARTHRARRRAEPARARLRDGGRDRTAASTAPTTAGATWTRTSGDRRIWGRGWYFGGITVEPRDPDVVYALQHRASTARATAARRSCRSRARPGGDDYHELWIDPEHPERRILGVDQGAVVSLNGGETWSSWYNQPTGQFYHVITDQRFPYWVYGAQQDSGAAGVPSRTTTIDGINMMHFREITAGGESDKIAPDPKDPEVIYGGRVEKLDLRTEQTQTVDPDARLSRRRPRDLDAAARLLAARSARPVLRAPAALPHRGRRPALDRDQPRPHPRGPGHARQPRSGHRRRQAARGPPPRRHLRDRALAPRRSRPLGRHRRRPGLAHARRGRALARRHARRPHAVVQGRDHRRLALRRRDRVRRGRPPSPRRLPPLRLPHARRRTHLDGGGQRHPRRAAS